MSYPECLKNELAKYGQLPTYDLNWDRAILQMCIKQEREKLQEANSLSPIIRKCEQERAVSRYPDLSKPAVYSMHQRFFMYVANEIVLKAQRRTFEVDEHNKQVLRFLLLYFNECPLAEEVFPDRGYKLHKNIMLQGGVGVGKTLIMQIFSEYLRLTKNPRFFQNVSVTQMVNHYTLHNNIDLYLYNEGNSTGFKINPENICLNDIGVDNRPFYGVDTLTVVNDFLHARNELWSNRSLPEQKFAHLTTNLNNERLMALFGQKDAYGRIIDRFKTYNIIPITGESRR